MMPLSPPAEFHPEVRVVIRWEGPRANWKEIVALRHVVPEFANLSLAAVRERVGDADGWELGTQDRWWANLRTVPEIVKHGLRVELIEI
jgi:hypothetical protein